MTPLANSVNSGLSNSEVRNSPDVLESEVSPTRDCTAGIVITLDPDSSTLDLLAALARQVSRIVVVDNGSNTQMQGQLASSVTQLNGHVIFNSENLGISVALNQGATWARCSGYAWALLLDQDTQISPQLLEALCGLYRSFPQRQSLAVIAANYMDVVRGRVRVPRPQVRGCPWVESTSAITSGSLASLSAYSTIGPFREELFVDHIDTDYCLRAKAKGFKLIKSVAPLTVHSIGVVSVHKILGITFGTSNHSHIRRYYITRNITVLAREYMFSEPLFVINAIWTLIKSIVLFLILEDAKLLKLRYSALGLVHGVRGRLGRL